MRRRRVDVDSAPKMRFQVEFSSKKCEFLKISPSRRVQNSIWGRRTGGAGLRSRSSASSKEEKEEIEHQQHQQHTHTHTIPALPPPRTRRE